jgi:hypothetical protein
VIEVTARPGQVLTRPEHDQVEVTARPGQVLTCHAAAEAANAAAHMTAAAPAPAARKRVSSQSPCESGGRR